MNLDEAKKIAKAVRGDAITYEKRLHDKIVSSGVGRNRNSASYHPNESDTSYVDHEGNEHHIEIKSHEAYSRGASIALAHTKERGWHVTDTSSKKKPETAEFMKTHVIPHLNKHHSNGNLDKDVYIPSPRAVDGIKAHCRDKNTAYINYPHGGFYHTGKDPAKLGAPELQGDGRIRVRLKKDGLGRVSKTAEIELTKLHKPSHLSLEADIPK